MVLVAAITEPNFLGTDRLNVADHLVRAVFGRIANSDACSDLQIVVFHYGRSS